MQVYTVLRVFSTGSWKYSICSFGDLWFIYHWRYSSQQCDFRLTAWSEEASFNLLIFVFSWFKFVILSYRCFSCCCDTSCQERCICRRYDNKRLYLAWSWSYICCSHGRGIYCVFFTVSLHKQLYTIHSPTMCVHIVCESLYSRVCS